MPDPWPTPQAWLYGWVDTDVVGYRRMSVGGTAITMTAGYYRWPGFVTQLSTDLGAAGWSATTDSLGRVSLSGAAAVLTWTDRLGWLLGMAAEAGAATPAAVASALSIAAPPGGLPLHGARWEEVAVSKQRVLEVDRRQRGHGYTWGSARIWRWVLTMHHAVHASFLAGWCQRGQVTVASDSPTAFGGASAWAAGTPAGYVDGYVLGVEGSRRLPGPTAEFHEVTVLVTQAGP